MARTALCPKRSYIPEYTVPLKNTIRKIKKSYFESAQLKVCYKLRKAAERIFGRYEREVLLFKCLENCVRYGKRGLDECSVSFALGENR
jgi:hypothetical protein